MTTKLKLSDACRSVLEQVGMDDRAISEDIESVNIGINDRASLLKTMLDGVEDDDYKTAWTEYVDAVVAAAGVA